MSYEDLDCPDPILPEDIQVEINFHKVEDAETTKLWKNKFT